MNNWGSIDSPLIEQLLSTQRPLPYIKRLDDDLWYDMQIEEEISTNQLLSRYSYEIMRRLDRSDDARQLMPPAVIALLDEVEVRIISTDRLSVHSKKRNDGMVISRDEIKIEEKVNILAQDIAERIRNAIQEYGLVSQSKDRTFPLRVLENKASLDIEDVKKRMVELEEKRTELVKTGILEEDTAISLQDLVDSVTSDNLQTLSLYTTDTEEKLDVLSELSKTITLFKSLVENKFTDKIIKFNKDDGVKFETTYSNTAIAPSKLSSGEQHELVMLYDLVFNTTENTLVLIDEPELSLHIEWQLEYLDDLEKIINVSGFRALIATHSPQIINERWDLTFSLIGGNWV